MGMSRKEVNGMDCVEVREFLAELTERLNELDGRDFFGVEGWRLTLMGDDDYGYNYRKQG